MFEDQAFFAKVYLDSAVHFTSRTWLDYRLHDDSCVAVVERQGGYREVRGYYLDWLAGYLAPRDFPRKRGVARR